MLHVVCSLFMHCLWFRWVSCIVCSLWFMHCVADCVLLFVVRCALFAVRLSLYVVCNCNCVMCVVSCCLLFAVGVGSLLVVVGGFSLLSYVLRCL